MESSDHQLEFDTQNNKIESLQPKLQSSLYIDLKIGLNTFVMMMFHCINDRKYKYKFRNYKCGCKYQFNLRWFMNHTKDYGNYKYTKKIIYSLVIVGSLIEYLVLTIMCL